MGNFKAAVRSLLSTPASTLVVIATLAIAIGANSAIFSVVDGVLLRPLGYGDESRIVVVWATAGADKLDTFRLSPADYRDLRESVRAFDGQVALYRSLGSTLTGFDRPARVGSMTVTPQLFPVLDAKPSLGRFFGNEAEKGPRQVVITHASWLRRFGGDPSIVGADIQLDGQPRTVVGVTGPGFTFPPGNTEVEMYFPMFLSDDVLPSRDHRMFDSIARLAGGFALEAARAELAAIAAQLAREFPDTNQGWGLDARPLRQEVLGDLSTTLWVLSGAVFLVLLIACANIANVQVARSIAANREFAVRAALGARAKDLCKRSLSESLILGLLGGACSLPLAFWGVALLRKVMPAGIPRADAIGLDAAVLLFAAALSIGCAVLFGSLAALRSMRPDLVDLLKPAGASGTRSTGGRRLREAMVVVEVALAIVLLVGAGLMVRSFSRLSEVDPGFRQEGLVSVAVQLPRSRYSRSDWRPFFERLVGRVKQMPGIKAAGAVSDLPMSNVGLAFEMEFTVLGLEALSPTARPNADFRLTLPGYFEAMDMEIVQGRAFDRLDTSSDRFVAIVNQTLVERYFRDVDPIGRTVVVKNLAEVTVVGVVADIRHQGLESKYESEIFLPFGRVATNQMQVVVHSDLGTAAIASAVGNVLAEMAPEIAPTQVVAMSDLLWESVAQPRFNTALLSTLALCAAILAVMGTYGIVAYGVSQRRREIGVRMALGADSRATAAMIVRQALGIVLAGAALGILGALGATRFLSQLLFDVQPTDPLTYGVVLVAALLVGGLSAWMPARRATRIDPIAALRAE